MFRVEETADVTVDAYKKGRLMKKSYYNMTGEE